MTKYVGNMIILILFFLIDLAIAQDNDNSNCKQRLPEIINSYQPTILPVRTIDGKILFFDRKLHPDNIASTNDLDDIWYSYIEKDDIFSKPKNPGRKLNTKNSDVLFSITPDGKVLLYGTVNNAGKEFSIAEYSGIDFKNHKAVTIENYNNRAENFFAYLSADAKTLLLAIESNNCHGDLDIYVSFRKGDSYEFTSPMNLGESINTTMTESNPFLAYDNKTLYFSSNGRKGYGGKDLYMSRRLDETWTNWSKPINLGSKINSSRDENSIYLTPLGDSALISSWDNKTLREGLYYVCINDSISPMPYAIVTGAVKARGHGLKDYDDVSIEVAYDNRNIKDIYKPLYEGRYFFVVPEETFSPVLIEKAGYEQFGFAVSTRNLKKPKYIYYNAILTKSSTRELIIGKVFFDYDSDFITVESRKELGEILDRILYPSNTKLLIIGHTDEAGEFQYNLELSQRRADAVKIELIKLGFKQENLRTSARGKSEPISKEHKKNRRVEIFLIED